MALRLRLTPQAEADLDRIATYVRQEAPVAGDAWFRRLEEALSRSPNYPNGARLSRRSHRPRGKCVSSCLGGAGMCIESTS